MPGIGDLATPAFTVLLLGTGLRMRVPVVVMARMVMNAGVDALIGLVPIAGDLVDLGWKANLRNLDLLERHAVPGTPVSRRDAWFVAAGVALIVLIGVVALIPVAIVVYVIAGLVLAIMIIPFIASVMRDVFEVTPPLLKESAYGLGSTTWEVVSKVVLPYTKAGVIGGIMLGLGRALGETMAVAMVLSAGGGISFNLISSSNPASIASNIASNYKEGTPGKIQVLIATGLVLFLVTFLVNFAARWIVQRSERRLAR